MQQFYTFFDAALIDFSRSSTSIWTCKYVNSTRFSGLVSNFVNNWFFNFHPKSWKILVLKTVKTEFWIIVWSRYTCSFLELFEGFCSWTVKSYFSYANWVGFLIIEDVNLCMFNSVGNFVWNDQLFFFFFSAKSLSQ